MKTGNQKNKFSFGFWQRLLPEPVNSPYKHQSHWQFILGTIGLDSQVSFFFSMYFLSLFFITSPAWRFALAGKGLQSTSTEARGGGGILWRRRAQLAGVHIEFIKNTIWLPTSVFWGKSVPSPWIITINQKEWILTYRRLDGSQVELLFDPHHLSREIKFGGGGKKKNISSTYCFCILHRDLLGLSCRIKHFFSLLFLFFFFLSLNHL